MTNTNIVTVAAGQIHPKISNVCNLIKKMPHDAIAKIFSPGKETIIVEKYNAGNIGFTYESIYGTPNTVSTMLHCDQSQKDIAPCIEEVLNCLGIYTVQRCILTKQLKSLSIPA